MSRPEGAGKFHIVPRERHDALIAAVYRRRGFTAHEALAAAEMAGEASWHGVRTHNGIKALHIEERCRAGGGGAVSGATVRRIPGRFAASETWDAGRKLGQPVAREAMETCMRLADRHGIGQVSVDNAFHYLWGGGCVLPAARRGYIAYTTCTAGMAEVVPFGGRTATLGTNPHSWAFPTQETLGFPVLVDWATSVIAMGRIEQCRREGLKLPAGAAVDTEGRPTVEPGKAAALLPFGAHKGYGLGLVCELMAGYIGGSLPTLRNRGPVAGEKHTVSLYFQAIHPDALAGGRFALGRSQADNVRAVLADVLGHGNEGCLLPGQIEAEAARESKARGGLLFTTAEMGELANLAREAGMPMIDPVSLDPAATAH